MIKLKSKSKSNYKNRLRLLLWVSSSLSFVIVFVGQGCSPFSQISAIQSSENLNQEGSSEELGTSGFLGDKTSDDIEDEFTTPQKTRIGKIIGGSDYSSIFKNMKEVTGVKESEKCRKIFEEERVFLPEAHDIEDFKESAQTSLALLAACTCEVSVFEQPLARDIMLVDFDYDQSRMSNSEIDDVVDRLVDRAWGSNNSQIPNLSRGILITLAREIRDSAGRDNTKKTVYGVCTAMLSSLSTHLL